MSKKTFFIAGTDTEVGKTFVSVALLEGVKQKGAKQKGAKENGLKTLGLKPVAAGCERHHGQLLNEDALAIQGASTVRCDYDQINPFALEPAIAPHIAAQQANIVLSATHLAEHCERILVQEDTDFALIEGAGGWRVPLNDKESLADVAIRLGFPVILVVGMRLGCINHALLTAEAITRDGLRLAGWIANQIDPNMPVSAENITSLKARLSCPFLGHIPFLSKISQIDAPKYLDINKLLD